MVVLNYTIKTSNYGKPSFMGIHPFWKSIILTIIYYSLAVILLFSGIVKILNPLPLLATLKLISFIPKNFQIIIATLLPIVEIGLGLLMLFKVKQKIIRPIVAILFFIFFAFSIIGTIVGFESDCGCFGNTVKSNFGINMILRNTVFLTISIFLFRKKTKFYESN